MSQPELWIEGAGGIEQGTGGPDVECIGFPRTIIQAFQIEPGEQCGIRDIGWRPWAMSNVIDMSGSAFCVSPMEKHIFEGSEFNCSVCSRPRALHVNDGFIGLGVTPTKMSRDPKAHFRNAPKHTFAIIRPMPAAKFLRRYKDVRSEILKAA